MNISVEYIDQVGNLSNRIESLNSFGLIKHIAIAGQGYLPSIKYYTKIFGIFCHYIEYLGSAALNASRFSIPPPERRDPTEKGHFSNLVGKGIGDFLSKQLAGAKVTHSYEAAMTLAGFSLSGNRPDLYCIGNNSQFALEAKGYSAKTVSAKEMLSHKSQAQSGPLPVNFSVASVSYNLYELVQCKYHDPYNDNIQDNTPINRELNRLYYTGIFEYLNSKYFRIEEGNIKNKHCYFIDILGAGTPYSLSIGDFSLALILQSGFKKFTLGERAHFNESAIQEPLSYLDTDGIGICLMKFKSINHLHKDRS